MALSAAEPNADMWARPEESHDDVVGLYQRVWAHTDATISQLPLDASWPTAASGTLTATTTWAPVTGSGGRTITSAWKRRPAVTSCADPEEGAIPAPTAPVYEVASRR